MSQDILPSLSKIYPVVYTVYFTESASLTWSGLHQKGNGLFGNVQLTLDEWNLQRFFRWQAA